MSATIAGPGVVRQTGTFMRLVFGELAGEQARGATRFWHVPESRLRR